MPPNRTRPTTDRVREALFSMLESRTSLTGLSVLDLFAGSGALGLEALSRGAGHVTLVESDAAAARVISANIATVGLPGAVLCRSTVTNYLSQSPDLAFDLVLADPPYAMTAEDVSAILARLTDHWVTDDAIVVLEREASSPSTHWPSGWIALPARKYGGTRLDIAEFG